MQFRKDIQGMRAIAVLAVFIFHLNPNWLPGGFIGVDIFFVISGYLISSIVLSKIERNKFSFLDFYGSRIKRITPAYYVMLLLVMLVFVKISFPFDINTFRLSFKSAAMFISNMYFSTMDTYFGASAAENPFLHTWTLAIEMQFYLFLPFLLFFIPRKYILPFIITLTIALFAYGTYEIFGLGRKNEMYFSLIARAPEFLMGTILAIVPYHKIKLSDFGSVILSVLGLALIIVSTIFITEHSMFPGGLAIVPCLGVSLLIIAPQNKIRDFLSSKVPFLIGDWSYSIYLWHWPIMAAFRYYYSIEEFEVWQYFAIIILTIIFSLASYYLIENPLRKSKGKVLYPAVLLLLVIGFGLNRNAISLNSSRNLIPSQFISSAYSSLPVGMEMNDDKNHFFLIGDSHSGNMLPYYDYIGKRNNFSLDALPSSSAPAIEGIRKEDIPWFNIDQNYQTYLSRVEIVKEKVKKSDIILLNFFSNKYKNEVFNEPLENFIQKLDSNQIFILVSDFPTIDKEPLKLNRSHLKKEGVDYQIVEPIITSDLLETISSHDNAHYINLTETAGYKKVFKDAPFYNDTLLFSDKHHLNNFASLLYARETEKDFMHKLDSILLIHNKRLVNGELVEIVEEE